MFPNNYQPTTMRPILKSQQSMNSVLYDNGGSFDATARNCQMLERRNMSQSINLQYARMVPHAMPLNPFSDSISRNVNRLPMMSPRTNSIYDLPVVMRINENAVHLNDIDKRWHTNEDDSLLFPYRRRDEYVEDYADIDLGSIHQEAQKYNDYFQHDNSIDSDNTSEYKWDHFLKPYEPIIVNGTWSLSGKLDYDYLIVNPVAVYWVRYYFENLSGRRMPYTKLFERNGSMM